MNGRLFRDANDKGIGRGRPIPTRGDLKMYTKLKDSLAKELQNIKQAGLFKDERIIVTPQGANIKVRDGKEVINFCANKVKNEGVV